MKGGTVVARRSERERLKVGYGRFASERCRNRLSSEIG